MINLLPDNDKKNVEKVYFVRLGVAVLSAFIILTVIHSILLLPSYILLSSKVSAQQVEKEILDKRLEGRNDGEITTKISSIEKSIDALQVVSEVPGVVEIVDVLLGVARGGVSITTISYTPQESLEVRGIAITREALRAYAGLLETQESFEKVSFPISNLAKEQNLPFQLSIILAP